MNNATSEFIIVAIQAAIILLPLLAAIVGIVWKLAALVNQVKNNKKECDEGLSRAHEDIDSLGRKFNDLLMQRQNELINLGAKVDKLDHSVVKIETVTDRMKEDFDEMKRDVKELLKRGN